MSPLVLPGTWNVRDLGGIVTQAGPVRPGVVFRTATLSGLDHDGRDTLQQWGVLDVIDLRGQREIEREGADSLPATITSTVAPFHPETDEPPVHEFDQNGARLNPIDRITAYYAAMPVLRPAQQAVAGLLRMVAEGRGAVVVHCAAGKDRTGWAIASLLAAAGADRDAILTDYLESNAGIAGLRAWMLEQYGEAPDDDAVLGVAPAYLYAAWAAMEQAFGSFNGYLAEVGVTADVLAGVRRRLVG